MLLLSFNLRGFGGPPKLRALKILLDSVKLDMIFLQEMMCSRNEALLNFPKLQRLGNFLLPMRRGFLEVCCRDGTLMFPVVRHILHLSGFWWMGFLRALIYLFLS